MSTYSLSATGVQALSAGVTAAHITITTTPTNSRLGTANPPNLYDVALLRFGDATGYFDAVPVIGGPQWLAVPSGSTRVAYACKGGAVISFAEVIGGSPPFGGVGALASLSDVALASVADAQVLAYQASSSKWINATPSGGGGGTGGAAVLLEYDTTGQADNNSSTLTANTWTDVPGLGNQTFTVTTSGALIALSIGGFFYIDAGSAIAPVATRLMVDSAGTPITRHLGAIVDSGSRNSPLAGAPLVTLTGLSVAAHTVKVQAYSPNSATFRCSWTSLPNQYKVTMRVIQFG